MKNIILAFTLIFSFTVFGQDGIRFEETTFKEILAKAKKEKKLIFVDAMASWCGPCKMMDKNVFSQKSVGDYYNATFINAKLDMEKGEGVEFAKKYAVRSYPSYLFLDGDGQLITRNLGYMEQSVFLEVGAEAQANIGAGDSMKAKFEKGEKDPEFLAKIIQLYANTDYEFAKSASERYFKFKKSKEYSKDEVGYLLYFIKDVKDANYNSFLKDKAEIIKIVPEKTYDDFGNQIKMSKIMQEAIDEKSKLIKEKQFLAQATPLLGEEAALRSLQQLKINYYELSNNFPLYEETALKYYENANSFPATELLKAAWLFAEKATKKTSLDTAIAWTQILVMQQESAENTYILALLYNKVGKKDEAKMYAKYSSQLALNTNKDATLALKLLEQIK